jgi:hypothetical protein
MVRQCEVNGDAVIVAGNGYLVASASMPSWWHVCKPVGERMVCDCKSYEYRGTCRHLRAVAALAERPAPGEPNETFALVERMMAGEFRAK